MKMNKKLIDLVGKYIFVAKDGVVNPKYIRVESVSYSSVFNTYIINTDYAILVSNIYAVTNTKKDAKMFRDMFKEINIELDQLKSDYEKQTRRIKAEMKYSLCLYDALVPKNHFC